MATLLALLKKNASFITLLAIYYFINCIFVLKYGLRLGTTIGIIATAVYLIIGIILLICLINFIHKQRTIYSILLILFILLLIIAQTKIDPYKLNIDRWSAIYNFLENLFNGVYPYSARTHLGNYADPFPLWMLVHIPFYFCKDIGLSFFAGYILFCYSIYVCKGKDISLMVAYTIICSPAVIYEVIVQSDLLTNILITSSFINLFKVHNKNLESNFIIISIIVGIVLNSRLCVAIPFYIWLLKDYLNIGLKKQIIVILIITITFAIPFIPFAPDYEHFMFLIKENPFGMQTMLGNWQEAIILIIIFTILALTWQNNYRKLNSHIGIAMFILVICTFIFKMWQNNEWNQLFQNGYDITYFNMSIPFISISISLYCKTLNFNFPQFKASS